MALASAAASVLLLSASAPPTWARADLGTVETLAGPRFCDGPTFRDPAAAAVRSLAVDPSGRIFFDTGPPDGDMVASYDPATGMTRPIGPTLAVAADADGGIPRPGVTAASRLAPDGKGSVLAGAGDHVVRLSDGRTEAGRVSGTGTGTSTGDGGPADAATFTSVRSIATDPAGNLYVADAVDLSGAAFRVRFVNRTSADVVLYRGTPGQTVIRPGAIATVAGGAGSGPLGEPVAALGARLQGVPPAMAADATTLYLGMQWLDDGQGGLRSAVRAVNLGAEAEVVQGVAVAPGELRTVAGGRGSGFGGDGGAALDASFGLVPGLAVDATGRLYLADEQHHRIRRVDERGVITTFAGSGGTEPSDGDLAGNGGRADAARLDHPVDVKVGADGSVYVSDRDNGQVRRIDMNGVISAVPTHVEPATTCSAAPDTATSGRPDRPRTADLQQLSATADGSVYFTGRSLPQVKRLDPAGRVTSVAGFAAADACPGWPPGCPTTNGGPSPQVRLDRPTTVAAGENGYYVFDGGHRGVRFENTGPRPLTVHGIPVQPGEMKMVVSGKTGALFPGVPGPPSELSEKSALTSGKAGELLVGDPAARTTWLIDSRGRTTAAIPAPRSDQECCADPRALATTPAGDLYVLDAGTNRVWFLNRGSTTVRALGQSVRPHSLAPVVGSGQSGIAGEGGRALVAEMLGPTAIAAGLNGDLYIADAAESSVRRVDSEGTITTLVGTGLSGFNGDGLRGRLTQLDRPTGVTVDRCGNILIADSGNDRIRRFDAAAPCTDTPSPARRDGRDVPALPIAAIAAAGAAAAAAAVGAARRRRSRRPSSVGRERARWVGPSHSSVRHTGRATNAMLNDAAPKWC